MWASQVPSITLSYFLGFSKPALKVCLKLETKKQKVSLESETRNTASMENLLSQLSESKETNTRKDRGGI